MYKKFLRATMAASFVIFTSLSAEAGGPGQDVNDDTPPRKGRSIKQDSKRHALVVRASMAADFPHATVTGPASAQI